MGIRRWCLTLALVFGVIDAALAQAYPSRPVQLIVPFDAGGSVDVIARVMQPTMTAKLGQNVVVINKAGASGTIGSAALAASTPDGHTVGILAMGSTVLVPHFRRLNYSLDSFDFICQIYSAPVLVMVGQNSPYRDIQSLLAFGKSHPRELLYGSPGIGTPDHINTASFLRQNGVEGTHVPYGGSGSAAQALRGNQLTAISNTPVLLRAHQLRPLAVIAPRRLAEFPDVPSAGEFGPSLDASIWAVLAAPKGLPTDVRTALERACRETLEDPAYRKTAETGGFPPLYRDATTTTAFVRSEFDKYGPMIKAEGLELQ